MSFGDGREQTVDAAQQETQEEMLNWLHLQTQLLRDIRRHTALLYWIALVCLVLTCIGIILYFIALISSGALTSQG